jgi:TIGR01777 family protein
MNTGKIILPGGTGFLGQLLAGWFAEQGHEVVVLTRRPEQLSPNCRQVQWDGRTCGDWAEELEGALAIINLAGRSVNCRYHERNRREMMDSRVESTLAVGQAIRRCKAPPPVWMNASTATIYKHSFDRAMDESGEIRGTREAKDEFSIEVAQAWERAFNAVEIPRTRKVLLRMTMVLGTGRNSVFPVLRRLARFGLGGRMAHGRQYVSWIHDIDLCRALQWMIEHPEISGPINVAGPTPLTNAEMMTVMRRVCGIPVGLPAPLWLMEIGTFLLRTETELVIKSRRVIPRRLEEEGFQFKFRDFESAIIELEQRIINAVA